MLSSHAYLHNLGKVHYRASLRMQTIAKQKAKDLGEQHIFFLEHNPVYTLGKFASSENLLWDTNQIEIHGIQKFDTDRGGDITYHGPGQIVIYPIMNLQLLGCKLGDFIRTLENVMIQTAATFNVNAQRLQGDSGVWVVNGHGFDKLGAIGLHVSHWITSHGLAFNVSPNLDHYKGINACGFKERGVVSLQSLLGSKAPSVQRVKEELLRNFKTSFNLEYLNPEASSKSISCIVYCRRDGVLQILMMKRVERDGGWWQSVTGMMDANETIHETAQREVFEETGITGKLLDLEYDHIFALPVVDSSQPLRLINEHCLGLEVEKHDGVKLNPAEHDEFTWVDVNTAKAMTPWDGMRIALDRLLWRLSHARD